MANLDSVLRKSRWSYISFVPSLAPPVRRLTAAPNENQRIMRVTAPWRHMLAQSVNLDHADGGSVSGAGTPQARSSSEPVLRAHARGSTAAHENPWPLGRCAGDLREQKDIAARLSVSEDSGRATRWALARPRHPQIARCRLRLGWADSHTGARRAGGMDGGPSIPPAILAEASEGLDLGDQPPTVGLRHGEDDAILVDLWTCELGRGGALVDEQQDLDVGQTGGAHHRDFADLGLYHGLVLDRERFHHLGCRLDELLLEPSGQQSTDLPCVLVEALVVIAEHLLDDDPRGRRRSRPVTCQGAAVVRGSPHDHGGEPDR